MHSPIEAMRGEAGAGTKVLNAGDGEAVLGLFGLSYNNVTARISACPRGAKCGPRALVAFRTADRVRRWDGASRNRFQGGRRQAARASRAREWRRCRDW